MKRIVAGVLALLLITAAAQAQTSRHKEHRKEAMTQLNLTTDQQARLAALRAEKQKAMAGLKTNDAAARQQRRAVHRQYRDQMKAVLTPGQQQKLAELNADQRKTTKANRLAKRQQVRSGLNLTAAQQQQLKALKADLKTKNTNLGANTALSEAARKEQRKALVMQHRQLVKEVLTPEQRQKLSELHQAHRAKSGK